MAELVDAQASGAGDRKVVEVRVLFWAPFVLPGTSENVQKTGDFSRFLCYDCPVKSGRIRHQSGTKRVFLRVSFRSFSKGDTRSEEHTSELQSLMRISYAVFCLKKKNDNTTIKQETY